MTHFFKAFKFCPVCGSDKFKINSKISKKCENCGFEYYKNPSIGAVPLIFDDKERLLVMRRAKNPGKGKLGFPGGFVDIGETVEQALIREAKEELNIDIEVCEYLFSIPSSYVYSIIDTNPLDIIFKCKIKNIDNMKLQESEISEAFFLKKNELIPEEFGLPGNKKAIEIIINNNIWEKINN